MSVDQAPTFVASYKTFIYFLNVGAKGVLILPAYKYMPVKSVQ